MIIAGLCVLCACNENKVWDGELYNDISTHMKEDFLENNKTYGVYYSVKEFDSETNSWEDKIQIEKDAPATRSFIVDNPSVFSDIFEDFETDINFETDMLIVHLFTDTNMRPVVVQNVEVKNKKLSVKYFVQPGNSEVNDSTAPGLKCFAIKIKKTQIDDIEFIKN